MCAKLEMAPAGVMSCMDWRRNRREMIGDNDITATPRMLYTILFVNMVSSEAVSSKFA